MHVPPQGLVEMLVPSRSWNIQPAVTKQRGGNTYLTQISRYASDYLDSLWQEMKKITQEKN